MPRAGVRLALAGLGCDVDDPAVLAERAEAALDRARRFGDVTLEMKALAAAAWPMSAGRRRRGLGHGRRSHGIGLHRRHLYDLAVIGKSVCSFYTACHTVADFERVEAWSPVLRERGIIADAPGPQP